VGSARLEVTVRRPILVALLFALPALVLAAPVPEGMVLVPAGPFTMGSDIDPEEKRPKVAQDETPTHQVTVPAFLMDRHEVTNGEFEKFMKAGGYAKKDLWSKDGWTWREANAITGPKDFKARKTALGDAFTKHPVVGVSYWEAEAYARFAGKRLPTEVEWEKAARGKGGRTYPWGEKPEAGGPVGDPTTKTYAVGTNAKDRSANGVMDLGGNVAEWTSSWFAAYPESKHESPHHGKTYRVVRGGSWRFETAIKRRGAWRGYWRYGKPDARIPFIGIRLVKDVKAD
jgi:formylglycine-generating enzyme required for sulfatase activity